MDLTTLTYEEIWRNGINLNYIVNAYSMLMSLPGADRERGLLPDGRPFFGRNPFIDKLIGNSWVREMIIDGCSPEDIKSMWKDDVERFRSLGSQYMSLLSMPMARLRATAAMMLMRMFSASGYTDTCAAMCGHGS